MADYAGLNYLWALPHITTPVNSIIEVGSRDGLDAVALAEALHASAIAFECDPDQFKVVERNLQASGLPDLRAIELALSDENTELEFWAVDTSIYDNTGTGSFYQANFDNRQHDDVDAGRAPIQRRISVQAARFDTLDIPAPDLLVMDVQGAETKVLHGFGERLRECTYVICEAERVPSYQGGNPFADVDRVLKQAGFRIAASTVGSGRTLDRWIHFWRTNLRIAMRERTLHPMRVYQGVFDVLYVNTKRT